MSFNCSSLYKSKPTAVEYRVCPLKLVIPGIGLGLPILADIENICSACVSNPDILEPPPVNTIPALIFEDHPLEFISF